MTGSLPPAAGATFMSESRSTGQARNRSRRHNLAGLGFAAPAAMRTRTWIAPTGPALVLSALALVGCGSGAENTGPPRPRPVVSMTPSDLTSAVGAAPLQIAIDNYSAAVGVSLLGPVAAEVGLVSWPEGDPVRVTTELQAFEPRRENGFDVFGSGKITVAPGAPLEDRWYFLYLAGAPADVELAGAPRLRKLADGRAGVRFTLSSDPRMTWVRRCLVDGETSGKVVVDFSEIVVLDSAEALTVETSGACTRPTVGDRDGIGNSFSFACDGLTSNTPIRVVVANTVVADGGRPVRGAGVPMDFPPVAFEPGSDCQIATIPPEVRRAAIGGPCR